MPQDVTPNPTNTPENQPDTTPNIFANHPSNLKKSHNKSIPIIIILAILALAGIGTSIFFGVKNANLASEISKLKIELDNYANKDNSNQNTTDEPQTSNSQTPSIPESKQLYFEPEGWNVKFAYPEGVTEVNNGNNVNPGDNLYISSITYNGKTYDVDLFGGRDVYRHYPFFLGHIERWDNNATHESWDQNPTQLGGVLIFEQGPIGYYYGSYGGNGFETGSEADYNLAVELTSQLLHNITAK